jgi:UDP-N-acetylglucosamine 2-epimerase (non-hydrolysing)
VKKRVLLVIGTRPEAIKLIPLYRALKEASIDAILCATNQHTDLLVQACTIFDVIPDISLNIMHKNQDLFHITQAVLEKLKLVYTELKPDLVIVQGDTTTAFVAALAAFYLKIEIAHIEAGLRSGDKFAPYPEEINRKFITQLATYHFAPTQQNMAQLIAEGIAQTDVFCTGNTVVDALLLIKNKIERGAVIITESIKKIVQKKQDENKKLVLLTAHRRESFGQGLKRIFSAIQRFMHDHQDVIIVYPSHPNPLIMQAIDESGLRMLKNMFVCQPLSYVDLVFLLMSSDFVVTDSGGIQEESVSLGKPVLVLRNVSERIECFVDNFGLLVGTNEEAILCGLQKFYDGATITNNYSSIFGDGTAVQQIVAILISKLCEVKHMNVGECFEPLSL